MIAVIMNGRGTICAENAMNDMKLLNTHSRETTAEFTGRSDFILREKWISRTLTQTLLCEIFKLMTLRNYSFE